MDCWDPGCTWRACIDRIPEGGSTWAPRMGCGDTGTTSWRVPGRGFGLGDIKSSIGSVFTFGMAWPLVKDPESGGAQVVLGNVVRF